MTRFLISALVLLLQAQALPALAAARAPEAPANTPERTMAQNSRVELPVPPPEAQVPPAPPPQHVTLRGK